METESDRERRNIETERDRGREGKKGRNIKTDRDRERKRVREGVRE